MPPPPDDDRAVDDASQALSELSTNVNDFLRMQAKRGDDEPSKPLSPASAAPAERKGDDGDAVPGVKDLHAMQDRIAGLLDGMRDAAAAAEAK